jgi:hypothetical protein
MGSLGSTDYAITSPLEVFIYNAKDKTTECKEPYIVHVMTININISSTEKWQHCIFFNFKKKLIGNFLGCAIAFGGFV